MDLWKGNEAIAEAAIRAGCDCFFGYPITPQSEVPEYMSLHMPEHGKVFVQSESEVAAINMVYGAAGAGMRPKPADGNVLDDALRQEQPLGQPVLGHIADARRHGIAVNSLWPRTAINTSAQQMIPGVDIGKCRKPEILADAAYLVLTSDAKTLTGNFVIDEKLLAERGVTDFERYSVTPGTKDLIPDFFVD